MAQKKRIQFTRVYGRYRAGEHVMRPPAIADKLIAQGYAKPYAERGVVTKAAEAVVDAVAEAVAPSEPEAEAPKRTGGKKKKKKTGR